MRDPRGTRVGTGVEVRDGGALDGNRAHIAMTS